MKNRKTGNTAKSATAERKNQDKHEVDSFGNKLLNFCKVHNLQIVNGRVGKDCGVGKYTTKNNSVLDYMLAPPTIFDELKDFDVLEFNPILSDVHCPIVFNLPSKIKDSKPLCNTKLMQKTKWEGSKNGVFVENLNNEDIETLDNLLLSFDGSENPNPKIELFVKQTSEILCKAKEKTFQPKIIRSFHTKKKAWYDQALKRAKNKFHSARKQKNRNNIRKSGKIYKSLLNSKF